MATQFSSGLTGHYESPANGSDSLSIPSDASIPVILAMPSTAGSGRVRYWNDHICVRFVSLGQFSLVSLGLGRLLCR